MGVTVIECIHIDFNLMDQIVLALKKKWIFEEAQFEKHISNRIQTRLVKFQN